MLYILFIALGLSMDAFCASIALAGANNKKVFINGLISSALFGGFQAIMPLIGWLIGMIFKPFIAGAGHWIAFILLFIIGLKMILDDLNNKHKSLKKKNITFKLMLSLAIATSIDALIIGMGFTLFDRSILLTVSILGLITFFLSMVGIYIGTKCSRFFHNKSGIFGGLILIVIGIKILSDHLLF